MSRFLVVALVCVVTLQLALGANEPEPEERFEIRDGKCKNAIADDVVFIDKVRLFAMPFITRNGTSHWHGDQTIYCLLVLSARDESEGSTVIVKEGGVNHTFVTLEMHSTKGNGLEYNVAVYGKLK